MNDPSRAPEGAAPSVSPDVPWADHPAVEAVGPVLAMAGVRPFTQRRQRHRRPGNARLTALTGLVILALLPIPYGTALSLDLLWRVHYFSGLVLIPLLLVKLTSTGWRALRYYLGDAGYRADGAPHPMPRLTAPLLVVSTVVLLASGVVMMLGADRFGSWSTVHNGAALFFTGALGLHLLAHLWDTPGEAAADLRTRQASEPAVPGSRARMAATALAFVVGITAAALTVPISQWSTDPGPALSPPRRMIQSAGVARTKKVTPSMRAGDMAGYAAVGWR